MTIEEFAARHKLQTRRDEEGELIVRARLGQIYDYGAGNLAVMFMTDSVGKWNNRRKECEKAGMTVRQDGDTEGTLLFDPESKEQSKTAIRTVGAYRKVNLTPEQRQAKAENMARVRNRPLFSDERG